MSDDPGPARWKPVLAVLLAVAVSVGSAVLVVVVVLHRPAEPRPVHVAEPRPTATPGPVAARVQHATTLRARPRPRCTAVHHGFDPATVAVDGVTSGATVIEPPRDANGIPGVPPLSSYGKVVFALDRAQGILPGDPAGNVLLNAHTWPDGSALGNRLLANVHHGSKIVVRGAGERLCYHVTEEVQVPAVQGLPRYYAKDGPPQLAILVCSGQRLGPGNWTDRTIWFASPSV